MTRPSDHLPTITSGFSSVISLNKLRISAKLGVTKEERNKPQDIDVSFRFHLQGIPKACETDNIEDTVCYHKISDLITEICSKKEFKLLEYLCYLVYKEVRKKVAQDIKIWVLVEKLTPEIEGLVGSSSFEFSDIEV